MLMKRVQWTDEHGYDRAVLLPVHCSDLDVHLGVPSDPPDVDQLDWDGIKRDLHNELSRAGLLNWSDVQNGQDRINQICRLVFARKLINLYKLMEEK